MADKKYTIKIDTEGTKEMKASVDKITFTLSEIPKVVERVARQLKLGEEKKSNKYVGRKSFRTREGSGAVDSAQRDARRAMKALENLMKQLGDSFYKQSNANILPEDPNFPGEASLRPIAEEVKSVAAAAKKAEPKLRTFKQVLESLGAQKISKMSNKELQGVFQDKLGKETQKLKRVLDSAGVKTSDYSKLVKQTTSAVKEKTKVTQEQAKVEKLSAREIKKRVKAQQAADKKLEAAAELKRKRDLANETVFDTGGIKSSGKNASTTQLRAATETGRNAKGRNMSSLAGIANSDSRGIVAAYATMAANVFALTTAFQQLSEAAKFEQLKRGLIQLGSASGQTFSVMTRGLRDITGLAISTRDAMKSVALATSAGLNLTDIERLGRVAKGASIALGRNLGDAMDRLARGAIKLEPEILDELGIMVRLDDAVEEYANRLGKAKSALTAYERRQAFLTAVLEQGERKFGDIADSVDTSPYDRLTASLQDSSVTMSRLLNTFLAPLAGLFANNPLLLALPFTILAKVVANKVLPNFETMKKKAEEVQKALENQTIPFQDGADLQNAATLKNRAKILGIAQDNLGLLKRIGRQNKGNADTIMRLVSFKDKELRADVESLQILKATLVAEAQRMRNLKVVSKAKEKEIIATEKLIDQTDRIIRQEKIRLQRQTEITERMNKQVLNQNNTAALGAFQKRIQTASGTGLTDTILGYSNFLRTAAQNSAIFYGEQKSNILTQNDLLGKQNGLFSRLGTSSSLMMSRATAGWKFLTVAATGFGTVVSKLIPIIGGITTAFAVYKTISKFLFEDESLKVYRKALKDLGETINQLSNKWDTLSKIQSRAGTTASEFAQEYVIMSNVANELSGGLDKVINKMDRLSKVYKRPLRFFDDSTINFLSSRGAFGSVGGGNRSDVFFGAKSKELKNLNKELRDAPEQFLEAIQRAEEKFGSISSLQNKNEQFRLAAQILNEANREFKDLNKILPEMESNFADIERQLRSFNTAAKPSTSIDGLVDAFRSLDNITDRLADSRIDEKLEILTRFTAEASDSLMNFLNLSESELATLKSLDSLNSKLREADNIFERILLNIELSNVGTSLDTLPSKIKSAADEFERLQENMTQLKAKNSALEADSVRSKSYDLESAKAQVLANQVAIKKNNILVANKELQLLRKSGSDENAIANKRLEVAKLRVELSALITVGMGAQLAAASKVAKAEKKLTSTLKTRSELQNKIAKSARQEQIIKAGGTDASAFENKFITNLEKFRDQNLAVAVQMATASEEQRDKLVRIHKLEQEIQEARLKSNGFITEFVMNKERELELVKQELSLTGTRINLIRQEADTAKAALLPNQEKLRVLNLQAKALKDVAQLENSRVNAARELAKAELQLSNAQTFGISALNPEQEIEAKKAELRDRVSAMKNLNRADHSIISLKNTQLDMEANLRRMELQNIRARMTALRAENPGISISPEFDNILTLIEQTDANILATQNKRMSIEQEITDLKLEGATAQLNTEIALGNAGDRFLASINKANNSQRELLQNGRGFLAQLPFIGSSYTQIYDNFRNTTGRIPNKEELSRLKTAAVYQARTNIQLEAQSTLAGSLEGSFDTLYDSILSGNESVADSFKKMAISIVADLAKVYTKALLVQSITALLPGGGFGANAPGAIGQASNSGVGHFGGSTLHSMPKFADGGIYNNQGVVTKPTFLAGEGRHNEAIVPLPNGRSIPVEMKAGGSQSNNVNVVVNIDSNGNAKTETFGDNMDELGALIGQAVQKELLEQKRAGGILNKYGAA